jgi:putative ABC transport system permease protein
MMPAARTWSFIQGLFRRNAVETGMSEEIRFHIESRAQDLVAQGASPEDALRRARIEFGSTEKYREEMRAARGMRLFDELRADLVSGIRGLRRSPTFAVVSTISLALGIGANTLIFSIINSTLLKPMGYRDSSRLAVIWTTPSQNRQQISTSSVSTYFGLRDQTRLFESLGAFNGGGCGIRTLGSDRDGGPAERLFGQCFSPSLFDVLGVRPEIGRAFTDSEDQVGNVAPVVLISHGLWMRRFGGDPQIVGKQIDLNQIPTTVIGVMPANFELFKDPNAEATRTPIIDCILPLELTPTQVQSKVGGLTIVGRLKPGFSLRQGQTEIDTIAARLAASDKERHDGLSTRVDALQAAAYRDYRTPLILLEAAVAFVLLISCANVAGLLLSRTAARRGEVALRCALGAGRVRIVRQFVTENLPVAIMGGVAGVILSAAGLRVFQLIAPRDFPRVDQITMDGRVLAFVACIVLVSSVISSAIPALQASKGALVDPLKESGRATWGRGRMRFRRGLVMGQMALAVVLLICSGLMVHSFIRVVQTDLGADPKNLLTFEFRLTMAETVTPAGRYRGLGLWNISPLPARRFEQVLERLKGVPGIRGVAAANFTPFRGDAVKLPFVVEGHPAPAEAQQQTANYLAITRGFFDVMKIPLLRGRDFDERDTADSTHVMMINETMARQFFPNEDPIGRHVTMDFVPDERPWEIVGVVRDTVTSPLQREQLPAMYVPHLQQPAKFTGPLWYIRSGMYFVVRTTSDPMRMSSAIKEAVAEVDRNTAVADLRTAGETIDNQLRNLQLYTLLLTIFGMVATILAAIGMYGVMAYSVGERTKEIGIRVALGGRTYDILFMVFRQAAVVIGIGVAAGLLGSLTVTGLIRTWLFGITETDPATYVFISVFLLVVGAAACLVPARRALSVDPTIALKYE